MILPLFIIIVYVTYMKMVKHSIGQMEHLVAVLSFSMLLLMIVQCEDHIIATTHWLDQCIGWGATNSNHNPHNDQTMTYSIYSTTQFVDLLSVVLSWVAQDYQNSKCRKMINTVKTTMKYFLRKSKTDGD